MPELSTVRPLGVRTDLLLSPEQIEMMRTLEAYDLWFVEERLERKGLVPASDLSGAVIEFKRYMALVGLGYRGLGMLSREVDEVWHACILFTQEYAAFCQTAIGNFVHHVPVTSRTPASEASRGKFLSAYAEVFGAPPAEWYAIEAKSEASDPSGCGTEDCTDG